MTVNRTCLHHVAGNCTTSLCRWQDRKNPLKCTQNGTLEVDHLTARLRDFGLVAERYREELKGVEHGR